MLPGQAVPDLIRQGLGLAARAAGDWCDVFRPQGATAPMAAGNRIVRLPALFTQSRAPGYGEPLWQGIFDAAYTQPGDYLRGAVVREDQSGAAFPAPGGAADGRHEPLCQHA